jgi:2-hydroxychromene-2-carboxylate isomerase
MYMGQVIQLATVRRRRAGTVFAFDLASPWTYLAAGAVAEDFPDAGWVPARSERDETHDRLRAERAARSLGVRFAWPAERPTGDAANRAASLAAEHGRARQFALAAARLAWGWGQDLDDHALIAQAAGIAGLPLDATLEATFDLRRDTHLATAAHDGAPALTTAGVTLDGLALVAAQLSRDTARTPRRAR